jgi:triphosphatase
MDKSAKSLEIELKLILPGNQVEDLMIDCLRQNNYNIEKINSLKNIDIYMDTSDWALLKNKLSLRYRLSNGRAIYTVKSVGDIEDGIAKRTENEFSLDKPVKAPTDIPLKTLRKQVNAVIYPRRLLEQILIRTNRRRYMAVSPEGATFELSFDTSSFSSDALFKPRRAEQLHQFEAEVIEGPESAARSLAGLLEEAFGFLPASGSKMQYAMARLKVEPITKKVPVELKVKLDDRLDAALKKILAVELQWLREQFPGAIADRDPEFVHQARVATRRMRSALILFHSALPEKTVVYFEERLKWLGKLFGEVRDLDVFIINLSAYKDRLESYPKAKKKALETLIIKQRRAPLKALNEALKSRRYKNFEQRLTRFLEQPCVDCPETPMGMKPISEVAPPAITQKFENVLEQSRKTLANPRLNEFHCLRIQMKRLRYTMEFLAPPYGAAFDELIHSTVEIQDCLGQLQDTVFNQKLIKSILQDWQGKLVDTDLIFILGEIYQLQGEIARDCQKTFSEIWERFSAQETTDTLKHIFEDQPAAGQTGS